MPWARCARPDQIFSLMEVKGIYEVDDAIDRAITFLMNQFEKDGNKFWDDSVVGTGHRGILYLYLSLTFSLYLVAANQIIRPRYAKFIQSVLLKKVPSLIKRMRESADRHS